mmetsp:Transcript_44626/g.85831  ORF Transcript_44626/g.85831 Transcript_44626/m.85831 type:complete len:111 (+) Transcript_44626:587-919(+)
MVEAALCPAVHAWNALLAHEQALCLEDLVGSLVSVPAAGLRIACLSSIAFSLCMSTREAVKDHGGEHRSAMCVSLPDFYFDHADHPRHLRAFLERTPPCTQLHLSLRISA